MDVKGTRIYTYPRIDKRFDSSNKGVFIKKKALKEIKEKVILLIDYLSDIVNGSIKIIM